MEGADSDTVSGSKAARKGCSKEEVVSRAVQVSEWLAVRIHARPFTLIIIRENESKGKGKSE